MPAPPNPERGLRRAALCSQSGLGSSVLGATGPGRQHCVLPGGGGSGFDLGQGLARGEGFPEKARKIGKGGVGRTGKWCPSLLAGESGVREWP